MTEVSITAVGLERIEAAKQKYAAARRRLDELRIHPALAAPADYQPWLDEANRRVKEAFAEWVMLFEHETGLKLAALFRPVAAE